MVLYARCSHPNQNSVASQLARGRAWAAREDKRIVGEFSDDGISAFNTRKERPDWKRVMAELAAGRANFLWSFEISRHARDREVWAKLIKTCQAGDVQMAVNDKVHDPNDPDDGFMLDMSAALAIRESAMTRKRILREVEDRAKAGKPHGKIPYGYRRVYDPTSGALVAQVPNEETAPVIREMLRRVLAGESMYAIAMDFNTRGIPNPETVRQRRQHGESARWIDWYPGEIKDQLVSPANAGLRSHRGAIVADATWPAIISPAERLILVEKLSTPKTYKDGAAKHLLTGIAECGVCGSPVARQHNRTYPSYMCMGARNGRRVPGRMGCVSRIQAPVDLLVEEAIIAYCEREDVRAALFAEVEDGGVSEAAAEAASLRARLASFVESVTKPDGISPEMLATVEAQLRPQIAAAELRAKPHLLPPTVVSLLGPDARTVWTTELDVALRRQVVRFFMRVRIMKSARGPGARGFDPERIQVLWRVGPDAVGT